MVHTWIIQRNRLSIHNGTLVCRTRRAYNPIEMQGMAWNEDQLSSASFREDGLVRNMTSAFDDIAQGNSVFVADFQHGTVPGKPARNMLLITCMDCRIVPHQALGLTFGDMKVIRNGGGQVNPEVEKDVVIANNILECDRILIMQHTRCGMAAATLEKVREVVHANTGADVRDYHPDVISDQKAKLIEDVQRLRNNPMLKSDIVIEGAIYDVDTGKVNFVDA